MPIYAYKCGSCGHSKDVLQKISDAPLTDCPACGAAWFSKQVTAAGFQLKGSGWYVTDFRGGSSAGSGGSTSDSKADTKTDSKTDSAPAAGGSAATVATDAGGKAETATATAGGSGTSCASH